MSKIKILHIIKSLGRGGAETLLPETLRLHDKHQFEFHYIYFLPWKDQMVGSLRENGGMVTCLSASSNLQMMLKVRDVITYIRKHKIELVHAHLPWAGILARLVGKLTGIPILYTEHNKQERYHFLTRRMNLATMNWLTTIVPVSKDVEESIRKFKPGLKARIQTILNGVNIDRFAPAIFAGDSVKESLGIPSSTKVIGTIAVFRFQKRLDIWLELAAKIASRESEVVFIIVGDGPLKESLFHKAKQLNLDGIVHFVGLQTEVRPYLAAFDLYMMTSIFEGLPIAMLEAMSSGLPVITTDAGGIGEVVRHLEEGLVCPVSEPEQLVEFALKLLNDQGQCRQLASNARKRILQDFSMNKMVNELETLYRSTLHKRPEMNT
jgi:L-malate glycosyltransferase